MTTYRQDDSGEALRENIENLAIYYCSLSY